MKCSWGYLSAFGLLVAALPTAVQAHFRLLQPASWLIEDALGDPQKAGPCGGTNTDWGQPTYIITKVTGGHKLHIKVQEMVFHPGHYRVALAVNSRSELPLDPEVTTRDTDRGPWSVSARIQNPPQIPVLADGLWPHTTKVDAPFETDIQLPNINCKKCTLQVVEFMAEHPVNNPGNFTYHHCADLEITADPAKPIDQGWPPERLPNILDLGLNLQMTPWSLAVSNERSLLVESPTDRYVIAGRDRLTPHDVGSLDPSRDEDFNPLARTWWPREEPLVERPRASPAS